MLSPSGEIFMSECMEWGEEERLEREGGREKEGEGERAEGMA